MKRPNIYDNEGIFQMRLVNKTLLNILNLIILLNLSIMPAFASNWNRVIENIYIDTDSIEWDSLYGKLYNSPVYTYWLKVLNNMNTFNDIEKYYKKRINKILAKETIYCNSKQKSLLAVYIYDQQDNIIDSYEHFPLNYSNIIPDSNGEKVFNFICQYANKNIIKLERINNE